MTLRSIVNGQTSDASDINQYKALYQGGREFDVVNGYGATGNAKILLDAVSTAGSTTLTAASASFSSATDVGKAIWIAGAGPSTPTGTPTSALSNSVANQANMPTGGVYTFTFTYYNADGSESLPSPASTPAVTTVAGTNRVVTVTYGAIPAAAAGVRIYCATATGSASSAQVGYTGISATSGTSVVVDRCNASPATPPDAGWARVHKTTIASVTNATTVVLTTAAATTQALLTVPVNSAFSSTVATGSLLHSTAYYYRVTAVSVSGGETLASTETSTTTGAGADTYSVTVNWGAVTGAVSYNVYGRSTGAELKLANTVALTWIDTGALPATGALPTVNTAGMACAYGTNDTAAIQAADSAARPSGTVYFPPGNYLCDQLTMGAGATWIGSNRDDSVLIFALSLFNNFVSATASAPNGMTIYQLNFVGLGSGGVAIFTNSANNCLIQDCNFSGPMEQAINVYRGSSQRVQGCYFYGIGTNQYLTQVTTGSPGDCINTFTASEVTVVNNTFRNCPQDAGYFNNGSRNCTFAGNTVVGCGEGFQTRVSCNNIAVVGNVFDITGLSTGTCFGVIVQSDCVDCTITGNSFKTTAGTGSGPIAAVTVDSRSHRTVVADNTILGGTFQKGITIATTGAGGSESLDCVISGNSLYSVSGYAISVTAAENGAVISGNSVRGGGDKAIHVAADRCTVVGNKVRGNAGFDGITITGNYCAVSGNHVSDVGANAGIVLNGTYNSVTGNVCYNNNTYGINDLGSNNVMQGNVLQSNVTAPMLIASATSVAQDNKGWNPRGAITTPGFPATTVSVTNTTSSDVMAYILTPAVAMTYTLTGVLGTVTSLTLPAVAQYHSVFIPANYVFTPTYASGVFTWKWYGL